MAKRFTETLKWSDAWFRKLTPAMKCLFQYLCDNCDHAGVIDPDWEMVAIQIGANVNLESVAGLGSRVQQLPNGKLWVTGFVKFQYGTPKRDCKQHAPVFAALDKHGITLAEVAECRISRHEVGSDCPSNGNHSSIHEQSLLLDGAYTQNKDKNKEEDKGSAEGKPAKPSKGRATLEELESYCVELGLPVSDGTALFDKWTGNGWTNGGKAIVDWKATTRNFKAHGYLASQKGQVVKQQPPAQRPYRLV